MMSVLVEKDEIGTALDEASSNQTNGSTKRLGQSVSTRHMATRTSKRRCGSPDQPSGDANVSVWTSLSTQNSRKRRKTLKRSRPVPEEPEQMSPGDQKRLERLLKNRKAAQQSRERKKLYIIGLEEQVRSLTTENNDLRCIVAQLRAQLSAVTGNNGRLETLASVHPSNGSSFSLNSSSSSTCTSSPTNCPAGAEPKHVPSNLPLQPLTLPNTTNDRRIKREDDFVSSKRPVQPLGLSNATNGRRIKFENNSESELANSAHCAPVTRSRARLQRQKENQLIFRNAPENVQELKLAGLPQPLIPSSKPIRNEGIQLLALASEAQTKIKQELGRTFKGITVKQEVQLGEDGVSVPDRFSKTQRRRPRSFPLQRSERADVLGLMELKSRVPHSIRIPESTNLKFENLSPSVIVSVMS